MDWFYNLNGFWIFPLFCLLCMALMMFGCRGMRFGFGHGGASHRGRELNRKGSEEKWQR